MRPAVGQAGAVAEQHPWTRYVALGDSFTEGIGDPEPRSQGGHRGWADRVAEVLGAQVDGFTYANLAIRGRLLRQIVDQQVDPAIALRPDLVSISGGGNDLIRIGTDPDEVSALFEEAIERLATTGATIVMFNGPDIGMTPVLNRSRSKIAIYNENLRGIAARHGALVADMWSLRELHDTRMWAPDRLHFSPAGHTAVARMVLETLGVDNDLEPNDPGPPPARSWQQARVEDITWVREHLAPWVVRRILKQSSGDQIQPKRPDLSP